MADVKPLKLVDQGGGAGRLEEFGAGDRVPSNAVPEKLQALADAGWAANQVPYFTGSNTVDKFALSGVSRGILEAGLGNAANATVQSSLNDFTSGRLLSVGAGGIGSSSRTHADGFDYNALSASQLIANTDVGNASLVSSGLPSSGRFGGFLTYATSTLRCRFLINWVASGSNPRAFIQGWNNVNNWNTAEIWTTATLTPNVLASYTLATLPNAAANPRLQTWCSNLTGGAMPVYSDGTNWRRTFDNSIAN
ncbi:hypothetical protein EQ836_07610 [Ectopseudomonas mendocina]|uniref:Uncharacterized protein n=1 Tax=Ectopseudomonas mendocina TaxID=300 RepID=A0ABD7RY91_ECTME|nr:hypothetical protein [Pseudomonas mendocina]TRO14332.1 hypothetical protein EQ829_10005 [Pseudomonas mendocina]TRO19383.1 hypothetical protein EQ836_07610 [Pseudomonas mendocina]